MPTPAVAWKMFSCQLGDSRIQWRKECRCGGNSKIEGTEIRRGSEDEAEFCNPVINLQQLRSGFLLMNKRSA